MNETTHPGDPAVAGQDAATDALLGVSPPPGSPEEQAEFWWGYLECVKGWVSDRLDELDVWA